MTHPFVQAIDKLNDIANNVSLPLTERIRVLTEIYFMYQFDVHNQAKTVRRIQELC
jgi:hypothetical protein